VHKSEPSLKSYESPLATLHLDGHAPEQVISTVLFASLVETSKVLPLVSEIVNFFTHF